MCKIYNVKNNKTADMVLSLHWWNSIVICHVKEKNSTQPPMKMM